MSTIYLIATSGKLSKKGETLRLQIDDHSVKTIFPFKTEQLVLIGNIDISTPALKLLMRHKIDTVFVNKNGRFNGRLAFTSGKNVFLRQKQFDLLHNADFCLRTARAIAMAKVRNQLNFVQRLGRSSIYTRPVTDTVHSLKAAIRQCEKADNNASLRGIEGSAARAYFSCYGAAFVPDFAVFKKRSMNPPEDNVNAVLSFIYTMLTNRVDAALEMEGLDPHVGYYHALEYGKRSLAFDLVEEYRAAIADPLTVSLFNLGILKEDDFRTVDFSGSDDAFPLEATDEAHAAVQSKKGVLLNRDGLRKVIMQLEKKLDTQILYTPRQTRISYKKIILEQVKHFKRTIIGEEQTYKPLMVK